MYKFKQILMIAVITLFAFSSLVIAAENDSAIDILYSNGIVRGDGNALAPQRYITYGEFAAITGRIFEARDYEDIESMIGSENWERLVIWSCGKIYTQEQLLTIGDHFYDCMPTDFATELILTALRGGTFNLDAYYMSLDDFGYRTEIIPKAQYLTREQACEIICEMLYLEFPRQEDYDGSIRYSVYQYTLHGMSCVYVQRDDVIFKDLVNHRPERMSLGVWNMPEDIREKSFLEKNICVGMDRKNIEAVIGRAYWTDESNEHYYYYYSEYISLNNGNIFEANRTGVLNLRYENDLVVEIEFLQ